MADPYTLRILEIDGGGERGYLALNFLNRFVEYWGIDPSTIWKQFDVICGTSIGGILSTALAAGRTPGQLLPFFTDQGPYIFSLSSLIASLRPNFLAKIGLVLTNTPFYQSSGLTAEDYGAGLLYKTVRDMLKEDPEDSTSADLTLQDLKTNVIIPAFRTNTSNPSITQKAAYTMFSNLNYAEFTGRTALASDVALSTSAAPVYLPSYSFIDNLGFTNIYIDGGIYQNNPAYFGRNLAQMIKPTAKRTCILSIGTGIGEMGFDLGSPVARKRNSVLKLGNSGPDPDDPSTPDEESSINLLMKLFNIASTGGQESVARSLFLESKYTLGRTYYYRFQPVLDIEKNTELDNTDTDILEYYDQTAETWFENDIANISNFLGHLTA